MKRKISLLILLTVIMFVLMACGDSKDNKAEDDSKVTTLDELENTENQVEETTEEPETSELDKYPSVYDQTYKGYQQVDTTHILITNDQYGHSLKSNSLIYVVDENGDYYVMANQSEDGDRIYKSIIPLGRAGCLMRFVKPDDTYVLVDYFGNIYGNDKGYTRLEIITVNGMTGLVTTSDKEGEKIYDIYGNNCELIIENCKELSKVDACDKIGSYTYVYGQISEDVEGIFVYNDKGECIDNIQKKGAYRSMFDNNYVWDGSNLWDKNRNKVEVPLLEEISKSENIKVLNIYAKNEEIATVECEVNGKRYKYSFDKTFKIRTDIENPTYIVVQDYGKTLKIKDGLEGAEFVAFATDEKPIFMINDWIPIMKNWTEKNVKLEELNAYLYDEGVILVDVTVYYGSEKNGWSKDTVAFFLYEKDGYDVNKAISVGKGNGLIEKNGVWCSTKSNLMIRDGEALFRRHLYYAGDGVYYCNVHEDSTYTLFTANDEEICHSENFLKGIINKDLYVEQIHSGGIRFRLMKRK